MGLGVYGAGPTDVYGLFRSFRLDPLLAVSRRGAGWLREALPVTLFTYSLAAMILQLEA